MILNATNSNERRLKNTDHLDFFIEIVLSLTAQTILWCEDTHTADQSLLLLGLAHLQQFSHNSQRQKEKKKKLHRKISRSPGKIKTNRSFLEWRVEWMSWIHPIYVDKGYTYHILMWFSTKMEMDTFCLFSMS